MAREKAIHRLLPAGHYPKTPRVFGVAGRRLQAAAGSSRRLPRGILGSISPFGDGSLPASAAFSGPVFAGPFLISLLP